MSTHFFSDTSVLLGRSMRHITRSPDTIITVAITPIAMMLLFVYVFGGAIKTGADNYVNYLLPGIMLIAIASGIAYTAVRLFTDMKNGIFERFQSMPIPRSSVLWAHVLTSLVSNGISLVIIVLVAVAMGFRTSESPLHGSLLSESWRCSPWHSPGSPSSPAYQRRPWTVPPDSPTRSSSCPSSVRRSSPRPPCRVRCAPSLSTSRSPRSSTPSRICLPGGRSAAASGSLSLGASASGCWPTSSPWPPTGARSAERSGGTPRGEGLAAIRPQMPPARTRPGARAS